MLHATDIRQLSDADISKEITKAKDLLYRQTMGLRTGHLKATHTAGQLKKLIAKLLTIKQERTYRGETVATSTDDAAKKLETAYGSLAAKPAKKVAAKKAETAEVEETEAGDIKVKKAKK